MADNFTYEGIINLGYDTTLKTRAAITCARTSTTEIKLSIDKGSSTNYIHFPNGNTNISMYVGIATSASATPTYKQVYYGWDPLPGNQSRSFTSSQSWTYTVNAGDKTKELWVKFKIVDEGNNASKVVSFSQSPYTFSFDSGTTLSTNPTSVTASGIFKPGASVTISWSGVTKGTNNTVAGYSLFYASTTNGAAPTTGSSSLSFSSSALSGTTTFTVPTTATRGNKYTFGMRTRSGTADASGAYYPSGLKTGGSITVNRLPSKPTLSVTSDTISSTSSGQKVTATAGTDADGQTYSVYYATGPSGTKTKGASVTINPAAGSSTTYYFWTYDGLEYSSAATSCIITKNTKPIISVTGSDPVTYSALGDGRTYTSSIKASVYVTNKSISGTLHYQWYYRQYKNDTWSNWTAFDYGSGTATGTFTAQNPKVWTCNFSIAGGNIYKGYETEWRLGFWFNDGIEDSDEKFTSVYTYSARPAALGAGYPQKNVPKVVRYNQFAFSNVNNDGSVLGNKIRIAFPKDGSCTATNVTQVYDAETNLNLDYNATSGATTTPPYEDGINYQYVDITLTNTSNIQGHRVYVGVTITCGNCTKNVYGGTWGTQTIIQLPVIQIRNGFTLYNAYTPLSGNLGLGFSVTPSSLVTSSSQLKFLLQNANKSKQTEKSFSSVTYNGEIATGQIPYTSVYDFAGDTVLGFNYAGTTTVNYGVSFKNVFGQEVQTTTSASFVFDAATSAVWSTTYYTTSTSSSAVPSTSFSSSYYLQEGLPVRFTGTAKYYSKRNLKVEILQNAVVLGTQNITISNAATNRTPMSVAYDITTHVAAVTDSQTPITVKVTPISAAESYISEASSIFKSIKINNPINSYTACAVANDTITATASASPLTSIVIPSAAMSNTSTLSFFLANGNKQLTNFIPYASGSIYNFSFSSESDWTSQNAYFGALVTVKGTGTGWTTQKVFTSSNFILISKDNPTVSYRKNFVGINTPANMAAPSDKIVEIRAISDDKSKVTFVNASGETGLIVNNHSISAAIGGTARSINFANGTITGFDGFGVYIVETGENNGWYYYKYSDGTYDAYKRITLINAPCDSVWGVLYCTPSEIDFGARPTFDQQGLQMFVTYTATSSGGTGWASNWRRYTGDSYPTGTWVVVRPASASAINGHIAAHIHSTWNPSDVPVTLTGTMYADTSDEDGHWTRNITTDSIWSKETLNVTENGTYIPDSDQVYGKVVVNVP